MFAARAPRLLSTRLLAAVAAGAIVLALAGCTNTGGDAEGDAGATPLATATPVAAPEPEPTTFAGAALSGKGGAQASEPSDFPIPEGARSVVVDFTCNGGSMFDITLPARQIDHEVRLWGTCDGPQSLEWAIHESTLPELWVSVAQAVSWTAEPLFSTAEFPIDPAIATDCAGFGPIMSGLFSSDTGYSFYNTLDATEWRNRVDDGAEALATLGAASSSPLGVEFTRLAGIVGGSDRAVGAALEGTEELWAEVTKACNVNQTPFMLVSEFGG